MTVLSDDGTYRYRLDRRWGPNDPLGQVRWGSGRRASLVWIMLNPSTADAVADDPTIRRCMNFSRRDGYGGILVVNLYALRATDPKALASHPHPEGDGNADAIRDALRGAKVAVAAWGESWRKVGLPRRNIEQMARESGCDLVCLGTTKSGEPRHPLYVRGDTPFTPWPVIDPTKVHNPQIGKDGA